MVEVGEQAPDCALPGTHAEVRLSEIWTRGKVVLAFYAEDNTPLCSNEIAMLRDDYEVVQELGAEVVAVSADSLESHLEFAERLGGVLFALVSDAGLEATHAYGVVDDAGKRSQRAVFVIGEDGVILHTERWFQPGNPTQYQAVFRALGMEV